jgi:iron complex transport system substrate-binding protein
VRGDVVAAGQPAALLIWAVARERLAGWPRRPADDCLATLPATASELPQLGSLSGTGPAANLEAIAALSPSRVIDYGDLDPNFQALAERMRSRLGVEWTLIDGALRNIPEALRQAARLLGTASAVEPLAVQAAETLAAWAKAPPGPSFYYARGSDGLETGFKGALATEVLEGAGWANVAVGGQDIGRVTREQIAAWDPEAIVTLSPGFAETMRSDPVWAWRRNNTRRRLLLMPDVPFGWVDRPPSVNRLLGCLWLADPEGSALAIGSLTRRLYGMAPVEIARPRWIR